MRSSLWFDVEQRYKTILRRRDGTDGGLWFDVEQSTEVKACCDLNSKSNNEQD